MTQHTLLDVNERGYHFTQDEPPRQYEAQDLQRSFLATLPNYLSKNYPSIWFCHVLHSWHEASHRSRLVSLRLHNPERVTPVTCAPSLRLVRVTFTLAGYVVPLLNVQSVSLFLRGLAGACNTKTNQTAVHSLGGLSGNFQQILI